MRKEEGGGGREGGGRQEECTHDVTSKCQSYKIPTAPSN
jgi:hypothetical protein